MAPLYAAAGTDAHPTAPPSLHLVPGSLHPPVAFTTDTSFPSYKRGEQTGLPRGVHTGERKDGFTFYYLIDQNGLYRFGIDMPDMLANHAWFSDLHEFLDMLDPPPPPQLRLAK